MDLNSNSRKRSPKIALNKSASFSGSPVTQKYEIKQLFRSKDGETYLRHCSYEVAGKRRPNHNHKYTKPTSPKSKPIINSSDYFNTPYEGGSNKKGASNFKFGLPFNYLFTFAKHIEEEKGFKFGKNGETNFDENVIPMEVDRSFDKSFGNEKLFKNESKIEKTIQNTKNHDWSKNYRSVPKSDSSMTKNEGWLTSFIWSKNDKSGPDGDSSVKKNDVWFKNDRSVPKSDRLRPINDSSMSDVHQNDLNSVSHQCKVPKLLIKPKKPIEVIKNSEIGNKSSGNTLNCFGSQFLMRLIKIFILFLVPVLCGVFLMHFRTDSNVIETFDTLPIVSELKNHLYGQTEVIKNLEYSLNVIKNNKVFIFTGGTGVGKTYTAKIIEKNFPYKNNVIKIYPSSKKEHYRSLEKHIENNLEKNSQNLIVMDGLTLDDIYYILPIINNLSYVQTKFILILIFNLQDDSLNPLPSSNLRIKSHELSQMFYENNISYTLFVFENLLESDVKQCIRFAMREKKMLIDEINVENVLESINYKFSGCKGVYQKVSLLEASKSVIRDL